MSGALNALATSGGDPFIASISPVDIVEVGSTSTIVTADSATVSVVGGVGPFSVAWDAAAGGIVSQTPSSATTHFACIGIAPEDDRVGFFGASVTDTGTGAVRRTINTVRVNIARV